MTDNRLSLCRELILALLPEYQSLIPKYQTISAENSDVLSDAVHALAAYFRKRPSYGFLMGEKQSKAARQSADDAVKGIAHEINLTWQYPNGRIDFQFDPTPILGAENHEWIWQLSRHGFWGDMAKAYAETGDETYTRAFVSQLCDWLAIECPSEHWNAPGSVWRTIECGIRLKYPWQEAFEGFRHSPEFDDVSLVAMVASMRRQAQHLIDHPMHGNWLIIETIGLYTYASHFPEFRESAAFRTEAVRRMIHEMNGQILPDGLQYELSPDYHYCVVNCAASMLDVAAKFGREREVSGLLPILEHAIAAAVSISTPELTQPSTNDCYTIDTKCLTTLVKNYSHRPEFLYVDSNRDRGMPPEGVTASKFLPYAGFVVMRDDWTKDAAYLCFDVGSLGMGHMHQDKLNIILFKNGELLFDDGGGQYEISKSREYGISGYDHNVALVDGYAQSRTEPKMLDKPVDAGFVTNDSFDYAYGEYDGSFGKLAHPAVHRREVRFCKPDFFVIADTLTSADGELHSYDLLFHMDTLRVSRFGDGYLSHFGRDYELYLLFLDEYTDVTVESGVTEPRYSGWYVGRNNTTKHPATTLTRHTPKLRDCHLYTLLFPLKRGTEPPKVIRNGSHVTVSYDGRTVLLNLTELNR